MAPRRRKGDPKRVRIGLAENSIIAECYELNIDTRRIRTIEFLH